MEKPGCGWQSRKRAPTANRDGGSLICALALRQRLSSNLQERSWTQKTAFYLLSRKMTLIESLSDYIHLLKKPHKKYELTKAIFDEVGVLLEE